MEIKAGPELLEFVRLFNEERFFEAHEVLEALWRRTGGPEKAFYQGLIQAAAAFVHVQRGNPAGAKALLTSAAGYLSPYGSPFFGVDTAGLLRAATLAVQGPGPAPKISL